jgi:para-nitrobenzyl esterase
MVLDGPFILLRAPALRCSGMTEITTPNGRLVGTTVETPTRRVRVFRGVQYATAARFAAPVPVTSWSGPRDALAFGPAAPQPVGGPLDDLVPGSFRGTTDEGACLTLNVFTPEDASEPKPVLVWFPGGAFTIGAASQPAYDATTFAAEQDVVLVTCNYRLGALGFLDTRDAGGTSNCGLRDAIAALEWVHDNITAFGGDPGRVSVFGESAGGGMVLHLCASPLARGLFRGAIVQSGATFNTLDATRAALVRDAVLTELGLTGTKDLIDVPVATLLAAQSAAAMALLTTVGMMPFHPMVDGDVLLDAPAAALAAGAAAGIPMVIGTTTDEMRLFVDVSGPAPERATLTRRVARYADVDDERAAAIVATYQSALPDADTNAIWAALFTDVEMQQPAAAMRDAHRAHGPVYSYLFDWPAANPMLGACHGVDIPFTFGNFDDGWAEFVGADDAARGLSSTIRNAWAAFARTGDPGWPLAPATMRFGRDSAVVDDPLRNRLASLPQKG